MGNGDDCTHAKQAVPVINPLSPVRSPSRAPNSPHPAATAAHPVGTNRLVQGNYHESVCEIWMSLFRGLITDASMNFGCHFRNLNVRKGRGRRTCRHTKTPTPPRCTRSRRHARCSSGEQGRKGSEPSHDKRGQAIHEAAHQRGTCQ